MQELDGLLIYDYQIHRNDWGARRREKPRSDPRGLPPAGHTLREDDIVELPDILGAERGDNTANYWAWESNGLGVLGWSDVEKERRGWKISEELPPGEQNRSLLELNVEGFLYHYADDGDLLDSQGSKEHHQRLHVYL